MSKSALDEFLNRKPQGSAVEKLIVEAQTENEQDDIDYRAFGTNRNKRQAVMLDIRTLGGARLAMPYSYMTSIFFDASGVIVLSYASHNVRLVGRNLLPLYEALANHQARYIQQENAELERNIPAGDTFIADIEISET